MLKTESLAAFSDYASQLLKKYTGKLNTEKAQPRLHQVDMAIYKMENDLSTRKADIIYDIRNDFEINHNALEEDLSAIATTSIKELLRQSVHELSRN
ncbi:MAG: hypothetical protein EOP51_02275 [Sphingobacteriales bacterium]|nr:MAG: hypothetical protein EOP51_02275 [Sphingobacteriales bacterium]